MHLLRATLLLLLPAALASAHARIKYPPPFNAPPETPAGNGYNAPLAPDGSQFPCKGLHKGAKTDAAGTTWNAGEKAYFEILHHGAGGGEGNMAAHSGGSCQASLSFDGGQTWKVLHSFVGGCPRGVALGSNMATDPNQKFEFMVPKDTKAGPALFAWTWIAVTGNRDEYYMNCAPITISGTGTSLLDSHPGMFVGDQTLPSIPAGQCRSSPGAALVFPVLGDPSLVTRTEVTGIGFKEASKGTCFVSGGSGGGGGSTSGGEKPPPAEGGTNTTPQAPTPVVPQDPQPAPTPTTLLKITTPIPPAANPPPQGESGVTVPPGPAPMTTTPTLPPQGGEVTAPPEPAPTQVPAPSPPLMGEGEVPTPPEPALTTPPALPPQGGEATASPGPALTTPPALPPQGSEVTAPLEPALETPPVPPPAPPTRRPRLTRSRRPRPTRGSPRPPGEEVSKPPAPVGCNCGDVPVGAEAKQQQKPEVKPQSPGIEPPRPEVDQRPEPVVAAEDAPCDEGAGLGGVEGSGGEPVPKGKMRMGRFERRRRRRGL